LAYVFLSAGLLLGLNGGNGLGLSKKGRPYMSMLDAVMDASGYLNVVLLVAWVALNTTAELVHAWRSKTARSLMNLYTVSLGVSIVGLYFTFVVYPMRSNDPISWMLIKPGVGFMALCLIFTHGCVRGASLVLDLFGVKSQNWLRIGCAKCAKAPLRVFLWFFSGMAVIYVLTIAPVLLVWILAYVSIRK
jgi:hypothetical protein